MSSSFNSLALHLIRWALMDRPCRIEHHPLRLLFDLCTCKASILITSIFIQGRSCCSCRWCFSRCSPEHQCRDGPPYPLYCHYRKSRHLGDQQYLTPRRVLVQVVSSPMSPRWLPSSTVAGSGKRLSRAERLSLSAPTSPSRVSTFVRPFHAAFLLQC